MPLIDTKQADKTGRRVQILLTSRRVTEAFREALLAAASQVDLSPGEYALMAAGEKLAAAGANLPGVFFTGDIDHHNDNHERTAARRRA